MRWALAMAATLLASALGSDTAQAEAMRCGTHLLKDTATLAQTLDTCGEPARRETRVEREESGVIGPGGHVTIASRDVVVDVLHYELGAHQWAYELVFRDGRMAVMARRERPSH